MRSVVALAVVGAAVQLLAGVVSAQDLFPPDQGTALFEAEDYGSLRSRIERLEANQGLSPSAASPERRFLPAVRGLYFQFDNVFMKPYLSQNSAFTAQDQNEGMHNIGFNFDQEYSPRFEAGYLNPTAKLGFRARYWHFQTDSRVGPADDTNGLIASDAISVAVGATVQDIDTVTSVVYDLDLKVLDIEAIGQVGSGTVSAGIRSSRIGQKYRLGTDSGPLSTNLSVTGIGPTLAYEWKPRVPYVEGLSGLGSIRGSVLYGRKDVDSVGESGYEYNESSFMYNADAQLGLEYRRWGIFVRAALEAQYWANVGNTTNQNIGRGDDTGEDEFVGSFLDEDLGFFGMVFSAGYQW